MTRRVAVAVAVAAAAVVLAVLSPYWVAAALILRAAQTGGPVARVASWTARNVSVAIDRLPVRHGTARVRIFRPEGRSGRVALLVSGIHPDGIEDPRLIHLAHELAATGITVVTPEIDDLIHYSITPSVTDMIEDLAGAVLSRSDLAGGARIGLIGVSFSGGLAVVAAGRASVRDRIAYVLSFGGQGNLPRVLRYLCTGEGDSRPPHDYAVAIVLHQAADLTVPPGQVARLREGIELFLDASTMYRSAPQRADDMFAQAREYESTLAEPAATLMKHVNDRDVSSLGARLVPFLPLLGQAAALSPDQSPAPTAPVYLLHGVDDNVIPSMESVRLAEHLRGRTRVRTLISGFLTHVDVAAVPGLQDTWEMVAFWKALLDED